MNIAILGMGYVGCTVAACLVEQGHTVFGVEVNEKKRQALSRGESTVSEPGVAGRLETGISENRFTSVGTLNELSFVPDIIMVSVGTPSSPTGEVDMDSVLAVTDDMGEFIRGLEPDTQILCVYRSTMVPGSMEQLVLPRLAQAAGEAAGNKYEVAYNPEFLRESTAVADYYDPPKIVVGERAPGATKRLGGVYDELSAPFYETTFAEAELVKYGDNWFHATKVAFANEMGRLAHSLGISADKIMDIFVVDTKLNISPYYMRPGLPFGGSCLPKDVRALQALSRKQGAQMPVLNAVTESNASHLSYTIGRVTSRVSPGDTAVLIGLSFKSDTDDLRESPMVELAEALVGRGIQLRIYDPDLASEKLLGANLRYALNRLPHLEKLLLRSDEGIEYDYQFAIVAKKKNNELLDRLSAADSRASIIDLTVW